MSDPAVEVHSVSKTFRVYSDRNRSLKATFLNRRRSAFEEFWALTDVDLQIPKGVTFGLLGHNGSGKSTLLKCLARILTPNSGSITTRGRTAAMLEVGSGFHPELSGRENIYLNGSILGMSRQEIDRKFEDIVDFSGVGAFIDQPVKNYSSGMYVRLGFSVSIHVEPDILLVDEVLAVGDMEFQEKCMDKFAELKDQGRTVVVVSHGLEQLRTFCDEAAWLDAGKIVDVGKATTIVDAYADKGHGVQIVESGGTRFGSGEVQITRMEWLDAQGRDSRECRTGDPVTIRLHFHSSQSIERPVFGVSIDTREGYFVWGHHGLDARYVPERLPAGDGHVDVVIPWLPLRPNTYLLSASVQSFDTVHVYDAWQKGLRFEVRPSPEMESGGVVSFRSGFTNLSPASEMVAIPARWVQT